MITLRPEQEEAVRQAMAYDGFLLYMEQRTGKTPVACKIVQLRAPERLLVVCPKIAIDDTWNPHLLEADLPNTETIVLSWEAIWENRKRIRRWAPDFVLADELHRAKNPHSKQSRALRLISKGAKWKLGLTGTPIEKGIENAWAQFDFIDRTIFGKWGDFQDRYLVYGGFRGHKVIGVQNEEEFNRKFNSRFYRVLLEDVKEVPTQLDPPHLWTFDLNDSRPQYESMERKFIVELQEHMLKRKVYVKVMNPRTGQYEFTKRRKKQLVAPIILTQALRLHQLSGGFIQDDEGLVYRFGDEKVTQTCALVLALNQPTVVFVRFKPELYRLAEVLSRLGKHVTMVSGHRKHQFTGWDTGDVIILQIRKGGVSIDLARAEEAVFHSWDYGWISHAQAQFRIRSYTSLRARYHYMLANDTIDQDLFQCITEKRSLTSLLLDKYRRVPS